MNYETMWMRLLDELQNLRRQGVLHTDPAIIIGYMYFIQRIQQLEEKEELK